MADEILARHDGAIGTVTLNLPSHVGNATAQFVVDPSTAEFDVWPELQF